MTNFFERIAAVAATSPARVAIESVRAAGVEVTTYGALLTEAECVSGWLEGSALVRRGDRVALLASNDARWIAAYLGVLRLGAVVVPLDTAYTAPQVQAIVADSGARVVFTAPRFLDVAVDAVSSNGLASRVALLSGEAPGLAGPAELTAAPSQSPPASLEASEAAVILYTSGTTADPKGVVLTHANLDAERRAAFDIVDVSAEDVVLGVLPLFHALAQMANLLLPLSVGARVVFLETVSSSTLLDALQARRITAFACVPQFFYLIHQRVVSDMARRGAIARRVLRAFIDLNVWLRDHVGWNPGRYVFARVHRALGPRMRLLITGGSRFDAHIGRDLYGLGFSLLNAYGLTETSGGATMVRPGDRFTTSVGQAFPGVDIRIGAAEGDEDGEILIRGPIVMREYFQRPDATAEALRDGWLYTGDLGRLDQQGRLFITGRKKEVIVLSSGKNLYPEEIEAHYRQSAFIKELAVLGLTRPNEPAAERLHAVIVPDHEVMRERGVVNLRELIRFEVEGLSVTLPAHKRILSYDLSREPLPRTTTGKLKRNEIARQARERAAAPSAERPLTPNEREWLTIDDHARLLAWLAATLERQAIQPDANLELDLGLDSMERVELLTALEAECGTRVAPGVRATIFTARQLVESVLAAPATAAGTVSPGSDALPWDTLLGEAADPALSANLARPKPIRAFVLWTILRICRVIARWRLGYRVAGHAALPRSGPFIISPNHQTYLDGFFVAAALPLRLFRQLFFVGAAEYFETPFMAWIARAINIVPVDPDANLVNAMRAAATGLRLGKVLILFPEGERSIDGTIKTFRKGVAILASHLDVPIVPTAIDGLFPLWPRGRTLDWQAVLFTPRESVWLRFGAPVGARRGRYTVDAQALQDQVSRMLSDGRQPDRR